MKKKTTAKEYDAKKKKATTKPRIACSSCHYAMPISGDDEAIRCHRYPLSNRANLTHWCGEYKVK